MTEVKRATKELLNSPLLAESLNPQLIELFIYNQSLGSIVNCILLDDLAVGYCLYSIENNSLSININSRFQNQGLGYILGTKTVEDVFNQNKSEKIEITTLIGRPSNALALKMGFKEISRTEKEVFYKLSKSEFLNII
jgi:hypothetical protein